jgi:hypothetical protein
MDEGQGAMKPKFTSRFYTAGQIAKADGVTPNTIRRRARRERWPSQPHGKHVAYRAPQRLGRKIFAVRPVFSILNDVEILRALDRAAAVNGFIREMKRDTKCGIERALDLTVSNFRHLMPFSVRALRCWINNVVRGGLGALHERKAGRVGRRARELHKVLK